MPQAKSSSAKPRSSAKTASARTQPTRSTAGSSAGAASTRRSSASQARGSASSARSTKARASASSPDAGLEAAAERLRELNERIIEAGKKAGETTLASYEKALKAIATAVEHGPGSSDIEWISDLATAQAKFIRDVTEAWTSAARKMLK